MVCVCSRCQRADERFPRPRVRRQTSDPLPPLPPHPNCFSSHFHSFPTRVKLLSLPTIYDISLPFISLLLQSIRLYLHLLLLFFTYTTACCNTAAPFYTPTPSTPQPITIAIASQTDVLIHTVRVR